VKKFYSLLLFFLLYGIRSQTLTQTFNEPVIGDKEYFYNLDTSAYTQGMPVTTGSNVTWDYTLLKANNPKFQNLYVLPDSVLNSQDYPGCTFVQQGAFNSFFKSVTTPTTQTELLGIDSPTLTLKLTNSAIVARYPINFGTTITDNISGNFSAFSNTGTCSGKITTQADGSGTLKLPGITLTNVLRINSVQTLTLFVSTIFPVATAKQSVLTYFHPGNKFPVLSVTNIVITPVSGTATTQSFASGNTDFFVTGVKEYNPDDIRIYPNPSDGVIHLNIQESLSPTWLTIFSMAGEIITRNEFHNRVDLSGLSKGVYYVEITTLRGPMRKLLVVN
jgi:hypothetical protein